MKFLSYLYGVILCSALLSCDSLITTVPEDKLPQGAGKLVLHSYISPQDTLILVKITLSNPLLGIQPNSGYTYTVVGQDTIYQTNVPVANAKVSISNSKKQSAELPYSKTQQVYLLSTKSFPILAGETYTIKASAPMGNIEAACTVPKDAASIVKYKIDTLTDFRVNPARLTFRINFDWKDIPGQENFYTMKAEIKAPMILTPFPDNKSQTTLIRTISYTSYWDEENRQEQYQTDASRDGQLLSTPNGIITPGTEAVAENNQRYYTRYAGKKSIIRLEILNTDKNYFNYHRAVRINNRQDGNPFVEPVPIPTNIKNGLGCFAASNKSVLIFTF